MVSTGADHTCLINSKGGVMCMGKLARDKQESVNGDIARMGDVELRMGVRDIGSGWNHVCVFRITGKVYCWGLNNAGQCDFE
mmetsp:Transcript_30642/g.25849  ORF Transcript_30642/g.25849 Transcript_30642/m.25849 type:complete len:82 (-) Transcript_30642:129-374(-)